MSALARHALGRPLAAPNVLSARYRLEVVRVNAGPNSTKMVGLQAIWDGPTERLE
jgi:hypothetical protein